jgi:alpha-beta hydrolase superfamily lysophospholipase
MQHLEGHFPGCGNCSIYRQAWLPEGDGSAPRAGLIVVHGVGEHGGRYANFVDRFVPQGYAVFTLDHAGHGKSSGPRCYVDSFAEFVTTLKIFTDMLRAEHPGLPTFIVGHSMGGLISTLYLIEHQAGNTGAVLSAPAIALSDDVSAFTVALGRILSRVAPKAGILPIDPSGISRDPAVVQAYRDDPLVFTGKLPARLAAGIVDAMERARRDAPRITLPILILQGTADTIVNPSGAQLLHDRVSSPDRSLRLYQGYYHELYNEPEPERTRVFDDVQSWLEAHL